jgi:hypothetical protein
MCGLDFWTEPPFDCANDDSGDVAFIRATKFIGGRDAVEEFLACSVYLLAAGVGFNRVMVGVTLVSKLKLPLLKLVAVRKDDENDVQFLVRIELDAEGAMGSYTRPEHDACIASLCNGGHLNCMFELAEVAYGPHPVPGTDAFTEALKKRRIDAAGKTPAKRETASGKKKGEPTKVVAPRGKASVKQPSEAEVASVKAVK